MRIFIVLYLCVSICLGNVCDYSLKTKSLQNITINDSTAFEIIENTMKSKGYEYLETSSNLLDLTFSVSRDLHSRRFSAKTSLKYYIDNDLEYYTQGYGDPNRVRSDAIIQEELESSIVRSINHLPFCL